MATDVVKQIRRPPVVVSLPRRRSVLSWRVFGVRHRLRNCVASKGFRAQSTTSGRKRFWMLARMDWLGILDGMLQPTRCSG